VGAALWGLLWALLWAPLLGDQLDVVGVSSRFIRVTTPAGPHLNPFRTQKLSLQGRWYCFKRESRLSPGI
jgi:hypothetical protein